MSSTVETPILHGLDDERSCESDALRTLRAEPIAELTELHRHWHRLSSYLTEGLSISELRRYAFRFTYNYHDAQDVVSEAILKTATALHTLSDPVKPVVAKFLRTTIKNLAIDLVRARARAATLFPPKYRLSASSAGDNQPSPEAGPHEMARLDTEDRAVWNALMAVPPASRNVAFLKFVLGYEVEEIALRLRITKRTVHKHLEIARGVFKRHFPREGVTV